MGVTLVVSGDAPGTVRACDSIVLKQLNTEIAAQRALKPAADAYFGLELRVLRGTCVRTKARERGSDGSPESPLGNPATAGAKQDAELLLQPQLLQAES